MNLEFVIAGSACMVMALAHSIAGERILVMPLLRRATFPALFGSEEVGRRILRLTWHFATIMALGLAAMFYALSTVELDSGSRIVAYTVSAVFAAMAMWLFFVTRGRHLGWLVFLTITVTALIGAS